MNQIPSISVITCLYNTPPNLFKECLQGLVKQTFKDFEVLIVNDGSDKYLEENKKLIESLNDNRFKYFDTEHTGKSQTLNYAFKIAQGKYIAINDSDDVSYPERLEYQFNFLENNTEYNVISNACLSYPDYIIFPWTGESCDVEDENYYYKMLHPTMMLNRSNILNKVPFLFEQIYDSMEDTIFNTIMYYHGVKKIRYDNKILLKYSKENPDAAHYDNIIGYKKEGGFKLYTRTFNKDYLFENSKFTCILLVNNNWNEELEKTLLNIRFTSDNVKIIISYYNTNVVYDDYNKYGIKKILFSDTYINALKEGLNACDTEYLMIISKPIRFYIQNWDLHSLRNFQSLSYNYKLVQPFMTGIYKIDRDNYYNNNGKDKTYNLRYGQRLVLLSEVLTESLDNFDLYSEYITLCRIPILDNDLTFITTKTELTNILEINCLNNASLLNVYISLCEYLTGGNICIDMDIKCGIVDDQYQTFNIDNNKINYYFSFLTIINIFFNETKFIYEKILYENINAADAKLMFEDIECNNFKNIKNNIVTKFIYDINWFLKYFNLKSNITYWAEGSRSIT